MHTLIVLIFICLIIYVIVKLSQSNNKTTAPQQKNNEPISDDKSEEWAKVDPIKQDQDGNWVLNPNLDFKLTLVDADFSTAQYIRQILDNDNSHRFTQVENIVPIFIINKLKVKEIEDYKAKYRSVYLNKLDELKNNSKEYNSVKDEYEKDEILSELRSKAEELIPEVIGCSLYNLFECEPEDFNVGNDLIMKYGFGSLQLYFQKINRKNKTIKVPTDSFSYKAFEKLADVGLAIKGEDIANEELLSSLTLNELNDITSNKFTRKNKAIEYICNFEDSATFIQTHIPVKNIFKLIPITDELNYDVNEINKVWEYYKLIVDLLITTYNTAYWSWRRVENIESLGITARYTIISSTCDNCRLACKRNENIKYTKNNLPSLPFHIGCTCSLIAEPDIDL